MLHRSKQGGQGTPPVPPLDLTAYRLRAAVLLVDLKKAVATDLPKRLLELQALAGKLATLIGDLNSIGAPSTELEPLKKLLNELHRLLAKAHARETEAVAVWEKAEQVLQTFAGGVAAGQGASAERRVGFWK